MRFKTLLLALIASLITTNVALSQQGNFSPVIQVNDSAITGYELEQRIKFLQLMRFPRDIPTEAEKGLIEDRLRMQAAKVQGVKISPDQIKAGMAEFAGRANLDVDQFLAAIAQGGVDPETFRDFVEAGLAWREVLRSRFASRIQVTDAQIDRELSTDNGRGAGPRVLISEIIIPAQPGNMAQARALAQKLTDTIKSEAAFGDAARQYSIAASREQGGKVDWIPSSNLPPQVLAALGKLGNGQLTGPVQLDNGVGLFQLRGMKGSLQEGKPQVSAATIIVDYAQMYLPAGSDPAAELSRIRGGADTCDDLYKLGRGMSSEQLQRHKTLRGQVPGAVLGVLDGLDPNEVALFQGAGGTSLLMLCERNATRTEASLVPVVAPVVGSVANGVPSAVPGVGFGFGPSRAQVREEIINRRIGLLAESYLAELKANAIIRRP